jgi:hypothetical protein
MADAHPFDAALALDPARDSGARRTWAGHTHPGWANMVGPYGGITAAVLLAAAQRHPAAQGEVLALTVNYAGAVADGAFEIDAEPVRTGGSTQHWSLVLRQGEAVAATASAVFVRRRETFDATDLPRPDAPPWHTLARREPDAPLAWLRRYDMRAVHGDWPGSAGFAAHRGDTLLRVWLQDDPPRPLDALALASMADAFYPRVWVHLGRVTPASTVSLSTYLHADAAALAALDSGPVLAEARAARIHRGFFDQDAALWSAQGTLLATSHQVVYFKD